MISPKVHSVAHWNLQVSVFWILEWYHLLIEAQYMYRNMDTHKTFSFTNFKQCHRIEKGNITCQTEGNWWRQGWWLQRKIRKWRKGGKKRRERGREGRKKEERKEEGRERRNSKFTEFMKQQSLASFVFFLINSLKKNSSDSSENLYSFANWKDNSPIVGHCPPGIMWL